MAKKIKFESFVFRVLAEAAKARSLLPEPARAAWDAFVNGLEFQYRNGKATVSTGRGGDLEFSLGLAELYVRGDDPRHVEAQRNRGLLEAADCVEAGNAVVFRGILEVVCAQAGIALPAGCVTATRNAQRNAVEEAFHDEWASTVDLGAIDVRKASEACTSPELRQIRRSVGELRGKRLLDVGCGLGEASVYFAMEGAEVTSIDLSQAMLDATTRLARRNGVEVRTHKASAEDTNLSPGERFDVIYAGNLLHHVDIEATLRQLKPHLAVDGVFVSWDPLAYNPVINVYRRLAADVRTPDEHPLRWKDIRCLRREFAKVETHYFWLTTLVIFVWMAVAQRRNPGKERFWKSVVDEADRWRPLYQPLSRIDTVLLKCMPPLRLLCWNVVIVARAPLKVP